MSHFLHQAVFFHLTQDDAFSCQGFITSGAEKSEHLLIHSIQAKVKKNTTGEVETFAGIEG